MTGEERTQLIALGLVVIVAVLLPAASAKMWLDVYLADSNTPLLWTDNNGIRVYPEIMVDTELVFIVGSTEGGNWLGGLYISVPNPFLPLMAEFFARLPRHPSLNWEGSITHCAIPLYASVLGPSLSPEVLPWGLVPLQGFELGSSSFSSPGPWFILDYVAYQPQDTTVYLANNEQEISQVLLELHMPQVPSRDYDGDTVVSLTDFAMFANHWRQSEAVEDGASARFDLDHELDIGGGDLKAFTRFWLQRTKGVSPGLPHPNRHCELPPWIPASTP